MTVPQVAAFLNIHRSTVYVLMRRKGGLPFVQVGAAVRFRPNDVRAFIEQNLSQGGGESHANRLLGARRMDVGRE